MNQRSQASMRTSFDVSWSLVAQAVPENELFLKKMSIFRNRYIMSKDGAFIHHQAG